LTQRHIHTRPRPVASLQEAFDVLRAHGMRVSTARRVVLEALFAADGPISAERIAGGVGGAPPTDQPSVYRNLETLEQLGIVRHVHLGHGPGLYALTQPGEPEYFVCERCGATRAVASEAMEDVRALIAERFGWAASFAHFPIAGLCPACASAASAHGHAHA